MPFGEHSLKTVMKNPKNTARQYCLKYFHFWHDDLILFPTTSECFISNKKGSYFGPPMETKNDGLSNLLTIAYYKAVILKGSAKCF